MLCDERFEFFLMKSKLYKNPMIIMFIYVLLYYALIKYIEINELTANTIDFFRISLHNVGDLDYKKKY